MKTKCLSAFSVIVTIIVLIAAAISAIFLFLYKNPLKKQNYYTGEYFGIERVVSKNDKNQNGADDYTDILLGARIDAENKPVYKSAYYKGGYPPDNEGVCTDVIWRAFKYAGYNLKEMVDTHISENPSLYPRVDNKPDPNIDFRRVANLKVFFDYNAVSLTLDPYAVTEWQPGDIVVFGKNYDHIAIVSDRRNKNKTPFIIHNASQNNREEDALIKWSEEDTITGHYRYEG